MKTRLLFLITFLFGGGLSAQWGDCWTFDIERTYASVTDPYQDANGDGCRDDNYRWYVKLNSMVMTGTPIIPNGSYHRVMVEVIGTNYLNYNDGVVIKTIELNPNDFFSSTWSNGDIAYYYGGFAFRMEDQPIRYRHAFMRTRILTYVWHNFGPPGAGYYVGFPGEYCDGEIFTFCTSNTGPGGSTTPSDPKPDLTKGINGSLQTSEGTTFIDGYGSVPVLRSGANFTYNVDCKNAGNTTASNFYIETYLNTSTSFSPPTNGTPGPYVGTDQYVGSLASGSSINQTQTDWVDQHASKFTASGWRYFHTYFDHQRTVDESSEGNNLFTQRAYYYHAGDPNDNEGRIALNHLNVSNEISFLYQIQNPLTNVLEPQIGNGLLLSLFPVMSGPNQLQAPVFQTTITQKDNQLDITNIPAGAYRLVINGHFIKRFLVH